MCLIVQTEEAPAEVAPLNNRIALLVWGSNVLKVTMNQSKQLLGEFDDRQVHEFWCVTILVSKRAVKARQKR